MACCQENHVDFVLVGPEAPLANGLADACLAANIPCIGPAKLGAKLESSKTFCKEFLREFDIPTASYASFSELETALAYLDTQHYPLVIKADGMAAGKGVTIALDKQQAVQAISENLADNRFGDASKRIIIEEYLSGEEASFIVLYDGQHFVELASSQDHKARDDGDTGPNTGGMGAYSPAPIITPTCHQRILQEIIEPTFAGLKAKHIPYCGFLYVGLMIQDDTAKVLEFNTRCGDPETEVILMRLKNDFGNVCKAVLEQQLHTVKLEWDPRPALGVVCCAGGYPNEYQTGDEIKGLSHPLAHSGKIFHAGTQLAGQQVLTSGGRVLCVTAFGENYASAKANAYANLSAINWPNCYFRQDIGYRALSQSAPR